MNRRDCLRFLLVGAVIASPTVALVAPRVLDHLTLPTIRRHAKEIAANVASKNALLRKLTTAGRRPLLSTLDGYPVHVTVTREEIIAASLTRGI